ncbi:MAG: glycosyltransferase [Rhizobiaceae bacterium]|nr:glycosyltransferase [Rhizobiaceae bacterium]
MPGRVIFHDPIRTQEAFRLGRIMVLPSRADWLPYAVIEALPFGKFVVAVSVGGVGEMIPQHVHSRWFLPATRGLSPKPWLHGSKRPG